MNGDGAGWQEAGEQGAPDRDNVVDLMRRSVGPTLDRLAEAKEGIRAAKRLLGIAKSAGDHEVETMIAQELQALAGETRLMS